MKLEKYNWQFNGEVTKQFEEHVRQSVPFYQEIHKLVTKLSGWFIENGTNIYDLGTSKGEVLKNLNNTYDKNLRLIGVDNSKEMIEALEGEQLNFELLHKDIEDVYFKNASLITSVLTLQFISLSKRKNIITNIYDGLNDGGAFILVEKIKGNLTTNDIWNDLYHDFKLENGLSKKHIYDKSRSLRGVMKPLTLNQNLEMLNNAGFSETDIFFKWNNFVGIIAIK